MPREIHSSSTRKPANVPSLRESGRVYARVCVCVCVIKKRVSGGIPLSDWPLAGFGT